MVIFDEFHERSVHADMGLAFTLDVLETLREDLRLLVMSATINAQKVASLIGVDVPAPIIDCPGRTHPVDIRWLPRKSKQRLEDATVAAVGKALEYKGDVLVFLPGIAEINRVVGQLKRKYSDILVVALYGGLDSSAQDEALQPDARRRPSNCFH